MNHSRGQTSFLLYQILSASFCLLVVISNIISAKMIAIPFTTSVSIPAGLLTYPLTFLVADLTTEFFGPRKARVMIYVGIGMNLLSLAIIQFAIILPSSNDQQNEAFHSVMGSGGLRILASLTAYLISQIIDVQLYALIKNWTGPRLLWLRNNGSTWASQLADTFLVDMIYFWAGMGMGWNEVLPIILISYTYKAIASVMTTPLLYLCVFFVKKKTPGLETNEQLAL